MGQLAHRGAVVCLVFPRLPARTHLDPRCRRSANACDFAFRVSTNHLLVPWPVPRIIRGIDVLNRPGTCSMKLKDRLAPYRGEVLHTGGPRAVCSSRQWFELRFVELVSHAEVQ